MKKYILPAAVLLAAVCLTLALARPEKGAYGAFLQTLPRWGQTRRMDMGQEELRRITAASRDSRDQVYRFPNGDTFWQQTALSSAAAPGWNIAAENCTLRYGRDGDWVVERDPEDVTLQQTVFLDFDGLHLILSPPQAYAPKEQDCLQGLPLQDGFIRLRRTGEGQWRLELPLPQAQSPDCQWSWYCMASEESLLNWDDPAEIWLQHPLTGQYRWCEKGMYQLSPEDYTPTGDNVYFLNPASYIPAKYALLEGSRGADGLAVAMLDCVRRGMNEDGFIPISTQSGWLRRDFAIGAGYHDTRWSTDLALALLRAADKFELPQFRESAQVYGGFLLRHMWENGFSLPGMTGKLIPDYSWDGRKTPTPHASLNHMLAEALFLYEAGARSAANALVSALAEVGDGWLRPDGDLKYGLLPDGTETGRDYPYLTYNDLFLLREYFAENDRTFPRQLEALMESKLAYMVRNGITGYLT